MSSKRDEDRRTGLPGVPFSEVACLTAFRRRSRAAAVPHGLGDRLDEERLLK
ncbi:hypothetical protein [Salinigranum halophilum]|uniref:hypothetical protein n=1 Tax=Salinigranum halophilum TaxID=2565931 RepID=UPI0013757F98|nr:hypothetical protein [Salinigranum halophilum]